MNAAETHVSLLIAGGCLAALIALLGILRAVLGAGWWRPRGWIAKSHEEQDD